MVALLKSALNLILMMMDHLTEMIKPKDQRLYPPEDRNSKLNLKNLWYINMLKINLNLNLRNL